MPTASSVPKPWSVLMDQDPAVHQLIEEELQRQKNELAMIASENIVSESIVSALGNPLTNKYAEGLPHKRYYGGCEVVDKVEELAISRACSLFRCEFANVQPHSGASANIAAHLALLKPGSTLLGLDLSHGGHLTHGSKINISGQIYSSHSYHLDTNTQRLDYDHILETARKVQPRLIIAGGSSYPRFWDFKAFRKIADEVGAYLMVDMAHIAGLVAANLHPSPFPHAHIVTTTTHKTLKGPRGGVILWNDDSLTSAIQKAVFPGSQGGPLQHVIAMKATCFHAAALPSFISLQNKTLKHAQIFAKTLQDHDISLISGGTDNHLILVNLANTPITGKEAEQALGEIGIAVNKNSIPGDTRSPFIASGIRFGTPALTSRGLEEEDFREIASWVSQIISALSANNSPSHHKPLYKELRHKVQQKCAQFPLYPHW